MARTRQTARKFIPRVSLKYARIQNASIPIKIIKENQYKVEIIENNNQQDDFINFQLVMSKAQQIEQEQKYLRGNSSIKELMKLQSLNNLEFSELEINYPLKFDSFELFMLKDHMVNLKIIEIDKVIFRIKDLEILLESEGTANLETLKVTYYDLREDYQLLKDNYYEQYQKCHNFSRDFFKNKISSQCLTTLYLIDFYFTLESFSEFYLSKIFENLKELKLDIKDENLEENIENDFLKSKKIDEQINKNLATQKRKLNFKQIDLNLNNSFYFFLNNFLIEILNQDTCVEFLKTKDHFQDNEFSFPVQLRNLEFSNLIFLKDIKMKKLNITNLYLLESLTISVNKWNSKFIQLGQGKFELLKLIHIEALVFDDLSQFLQFVSSPIFFRVEDFKIKIEFSSFSFFENQFCIEDFQNFRSLVQLNLVFDTRIDKDNFYHIIVLYILLTSHRLKNIEINLRMAFKYLKLQTNSDSENEDDNKIQVQQKVNFDIVEKLNNNFKNLETLSLIGFTAEVYFKLFNEIQFENLSNLQIQFKEKKKLEKEINGIISQLKKDYVKKIDFSHSNKQIFENSFTNENMSFQSLQELDLSDTEFEFKNLKKIFLSQIGKFLKQLKINNNGLFFLEESCFSYNYGHEMALESFSITYLSQLEQVHKYATILAVDLLSGYKCFKNIKDINFNSVIRLNEEFEDLFGKMFLNFPLLNSYFFSYFSPNNNKGKNNKINYFHVFHEKQEKIQQKMRYLIKGKPLQLLQFFQLYRKDIFFELVQDFLFEYSLNSNEKDINL